MTREYSDNIHAVRAHQWYMHDMEYLILCGLMLLSLENLIHFFAGYKYIEEHRNLKELMQVLGLKLCLV